MTKLNSELLSQFIKSTNDAKPAKKESIVYGTITSVSFGENNKIEATAQFDGATKDDTPVVSSSTVKKGDRVIITIKDGTAIVTGNLSDRSASSADLKSAADIVANYGEFKSVTTIKLETIDGKINNLDSKFIETDKLIAGKATIGDLDATNLRVQTLEGDVAALNKIVTGTVDAGIVTTDKLEAAIAKTEELIAKKADISVLESDYATIKVLESDYATIDLLESEYVKTSVLEADYVKAESIEGKYANIDFSNISKATMQWFYANSGLIKDVVVGDSTITGELVGVTIAGDLIKGNTVKADKLVIKGADGLYYKLNFDAGTFKEGEVVPNDSLHGSVITAKSITAEKVSVKDLVAFGATIGGFHISDTSLYSGVKSSATNTTRGVYLDSTGQIAFGDAANYLRYYKDDKGNYKLDISADSITLKSGTTTTGVVIDTSVQYASSTSSTTAPTSGWSTTAPAWDKDKYMWQKTVTTYADGSKKESDPTCISGASGKDGQNGENATVLRIDSSRGTVFRNNSVSTVLSVTVYYGTKEITDIDTLREVYGNFAYLEWSWQDMDDEKFGVITATDTRIGNDGFTFTLSPTDVSEKVVIKCSLNTN